MIDRFHHEFVEFIPSALEEGKLYISLEYATAVHLCASGCGQKVVTPLSPTDWKVTYDGVSVSLHPSIGNWNFECRSHYWIRNGAVEWGQQWSRDRINLNREHDRAAKRAYYGTESMPQTEPEPSLRPSWLRRLLGWFRGR